MCVESHVKQTKKIPYARKDIFFVCVLTKKKVLPQLKKKTTESSKNKTKTKQNK